MWKTYMNEFNEAWYLFPGIWETFVNDRISYNVLDYVRFIRSVSSHSNYGYIAEGQSNCRFS